VRGDGNGGIVLVTKKTVGVTRITGAVRALPVSVAKKSINDPFPVISETEFIFMAGKQTLFKGKLTAGAKRVVTGDVSTDVGANIYSGISAATAPV